MNKAIFGFVATLAVFSSALGQSRAQAQRQVLANAIRHAGPEFVPDHIVVKLRSEVVRQMESNPVYSLEVRTLLVPNGAFMSRIADTSWTLWRVPDTTDVVGLARQLKSDPQVITAEPDYRVHALLQMPNDPDYQVNGLRTYETDPNYIIDDGQGDAQPFLRLWHLDDTNALAGWAIYPNTWYTSSTHPKTGPIIAMLDTGCEMTHPDFINSGGTGTDVSQGGQFIRALSVQFSNGQAIANSNPQDQNGHGTHTAGLALAAGNNGSFSGHGVIGTGYPCRGMILQVLGKTGSGSDTDVAGAIVYAAQNGADVINMSLGETTGYSQLLQDAVTNAFQRGSLVVVSGNEANTNGQAIWPAQCSGALAVTANGPNQTISSFSNSGDYVCVAAPGGDVIYASDYSWEVFQLVFSTMMESDQSFLNQDGDLIPPYQTDYAYLIGTSMATPIVSGAAGTYLAATAQNQVSGYGNINAFQAIEESAIGVTTNGGWEPVQGFGSLDIEALMKGGNARGATVGSVSGILYYQGTVQANAVVTAAQVGGNNQYSATTRADGTYRFEPMVAGTYTVTGRAFGATQSKLLIVSPGCDNPGQDFWCNGFTGDSTAPTLGFIVAKPAFAHTAVAFSYWAYDTETGIQSVSYRLGLTPGGNQLKPDTSVPIGVRDVKITGLGQPRHWYLTVTITNGAGLTTIGKLMR